jgi:ankyrin repeat protein
MRCANWLGDTPRAHHSRPRSIGRIPGHQRSLVPLPSTRLLLDRGATDSVDKVDKDGKTPLHLAVWQAKNESMVRLLLDSGATDSVNNIDLHGRTPLHLALERDNNESVVRLLLEHGVIKSSSIARGVFEGRREKDFVSPQIVRVGE